MTTTEKALTGERADLLETLAKHRFFLTFTARELTDEQAAASPAASALSIGGLIKHVTAMERKWTAFARGERESMAGGGSGWEDGFRMLPGETLAGLIEEYEAVARETTAFVESAPDLDASHPLPEAPWFEPGARWSVRRVLLHLIAETAQHAGHADIIRETLDGAKSMG
ncbi:DinB family protein [Qaidamihabitans albus]|uniref:DinB family protein n=1 Tax=Qaidamihabitans albus TaxID=2795733 RepID=UPI0018F1DF75|nr:DinB family protein [Qaidamihabitans albus]